MTLILNFSRQCIIYTYNLAAERICEMSKYLMIYKEIERSRKCLISNSLFFFNSTVVLKSRWDFKLAKKLIRKKRIR